MASARLAIVLFILISVEYPKANGAASGWLSNRVTNCDVSIWTAWGQWSDSSPSATRIRHRRIYRYAQNGGAPCPALTERGVRLDPWSSKNVAQRFHNKFLTGSIYGDDRVRPLRPVPGVLSPKGVLSPTRVNSRRRRTIPPRDTLFIIDMSGSIKGGNYILVKQKLAELIALICGGVGLGVGSLENRVAVITFSRKVVLNFKFNDFMTLKEVQQAIRDMPYDGESTCTGDAIKYAQNMFTSAQGVRPMGMSVREVLVMTDGESNCGPDIATVAGGLKNEAHVFALAIGTPTTDKGKKEIESMVTNRDADHIFALKNIQEFVDMVNKVKTWTPCVPYDI